MPDIVQRSSKSINCSIHVLLSTSIPPVLKGGSSPASGVMMNEVKLKAREHGVLE